MKVSAEQLAKLIMKLERKARSQGLYVGAGIDHSMPDDPEHQEGPLWKELKAAAKEVLKK